MPRRYLDPDDDIIRFTLRKCVEAGCLTRHQAIRLDLELRDQYGGKRYYVRAGPRRERVVIERDPRGHKTRSW